MLIAVLLGPSSAWSQASLEVVILGQDTSAGVPGVEVKLENTATGYSTSGASNKQGKLRFQSLSTAGRYRLSTSETATYHEAEVEDIVLRTNGASSVTIALAPKQTVSAEIAVTAEDESLARVNSVNAEVSSTLREKDLQELPIEGRDLTRSLYRLPNVTQATGFYPEAPNVSINGANSLYTNYLIDGLDNNENFLGGQKFATPTGFTQDVTVLTNTYSAELGRTGNGIVNVTSRSGGNDFHGEAFYLTRPGQPLDGESPFAQRDLSGNQVKDGFERQQFGGAVGGAIVKDRTFFYVNAESMHDTKDNLLNVPQLGVNETVEGSNSFLYLSGRVDQRWSENLQSTLRLNVGNVTIERQAGGLDGGATFPSAGNFQDRDSVLAALKTTYSTESFISETGLQYSRFRWNYGRAENPDSPQVVVLGPDGQTDAVLGHPGYLFDDLENTFEAQEKLVFQLENHTLKAGVDFLSSDFGLTGGGNPNGNYTVQLSAAQEAALRAQNHGAELDITDIPEDVAVLNYNVELRPKSFGATQNITSFYIEDLVSVSSRLNVTLGLRYDYDNLSKGGADSGDWNNLGPRLSVNYQTDEKSSVRAGYGIFYDKILYAVYSDALQQSSTSDGFRQQLQQLISLGILPNDTDLGRVTFEGNLSASLDSVPYLQGPSSDSLQGQRDQVLSNELRILNPDGYDNPQTQQFSLGYQRQLGKRLLGYVDLIHTRSSHLFRIRDLNAPAPYPIDPSNVVVRTVAEADATRPVAPVPGGAARGITVTETEGIARYSAANLTLLKDRADDIYSFRVSYTLSRLQNDTDDINFRAEDSNNYADEYGPSLNDRTHVISAFGSVYPLRGLTVGLAMLLQSGQPINRIPDARVYGTSDLNGDGRSYGDSYVGNNDRQPGESRNSDRLPWSETFDLALRYRLPVLGEAVEVSADVFNLFDAENLSGYSNNSTQSNQIQIGPPSAGIVTKNAAPPRQFQFGVRYVF